MFRNATVEFLNVEVNGEKTYKWVVELFENDVRVGVHYYDDRAAASLHSERFVDGFVDA